VRALRLDEQPEVNIEVIPLRRASPERCYLILFEGSRRASAARRAQLANPLLPESEKDRRLAQLEHETASLRDYLQATIEEHEASQEELKSAHEEVLSASEEFQSTNEELETAKEELQSANEELTTTNEELRQRNRDLSASSMPRWSRHGRLQSERKRKPTSLLRACANPCWCSTTSSILCAQTEPITPTLIPVPVKPKGQLLYHIGEGQWNVPALREGLLDVLARNETLEDFEVNQVFPRIGHRSMSLNARKMQGDAARPALILLAIADVTARNERSAQLAQEVKRKDEFLAMLAHELRNPLAPIATAVQILRGGPGDPSTTGLHDMIDRQTRRLARLVDELLDIGRFSRGLIELKREPVNLATIVEQTVAAIRPQLEARQHELSVTLPEEPVRVNGDPIRLEQVIANLLDNASKYTKSRWSYRGDAAPDIKRSDLKRARQRHWTCDRHAGGDLRSLSRRSIAPRTMAGRRSRDRSHAGTPRHSSSMEGGSRREVPGLGRGASLSYACPAPSRRITLINGKASTEKRPVNAAPARAGCSSWMIMRMRDYRW
jgi:two-component system CheB/CheR fusion protein